MINERIPFWQSDDVWFWTACIVIAAVYLWCAFSR